MRLYHYTMNTQPFTCSRPEDTTAGTIGNNVAPERFMSQANYWGHDVFIRKAHMWMSSFKDAYPQDLYGVFAIMEPWGENAVIHTSWDHYQETSGEHNLVIDFGPDYILWAKDQEARLRYYGLNFANPGMGNGAQIIVNIWFCIQKPGACPDW